jgi:hypothetical protein
VASVPAAAGWGGQQAGGIAHNGPRGSLQNVGFTPVSMNPAEAGAAPQGMMMPQGIPYSTFQMGMGLNRQAQEPVAPQAQVLPNGMVLLTLPPDHSNCGLVRCKGNAPRTLLLPPGGMGQMPGAPAQPGAMIPGGFGTPYMQVAQQQMIQQPMMPQMQMQIVPITAMTPMGPAVVGYQQVPVMNPMMNPMVNQGAMMNPMQQLQQMQTMPMPTIAMPNPMVASQVDGAAIDANDSTIQPPALIGAAQTVATPMALVATPFGYALQVPGDATQQEVAAQFAQMQQAMMQQQVQQPMNPYAGLYATPFGYIAMNQSAGQFGGFGQPTMMNVGFQPMGMGQPMGMFGGGQGGMSVSDMLQIMAFINSNNKPQRRARLFERIAERREARKESCENDPFAQLMQAWTTPYVAPDTALRMPARNAYPYGYFGAQTMPISTANYGGYHNLYMGNTTYPGLY